MKLKAGQQVFVTKWALSSGIVTATVRKDHAADDSYPYLRVGNYDQCIAEVDVHETIEDAQQRAKSLAAAKLKSLEKQAAKLRKIQIEGAKMKASKGVSK